MASSVISETYNTSLDTAVIAVRSEKFMLRSIILTGSFGLLSFAHLEIFLLVSFKDAILTSHFANILFAIQNSVAVFPAIELGDIVSVLL